MSNTDLCTIHNKTKAKLPSLPFVSIKDAILGKDYDLSISILLAKDQRRINRDYRGKDNTTNILSFPLSKNSGEITFDLALVKKEAPLFDMTYPTFLKFLFIHGCLHLKGFEHSSTMEKEEKKYLKIFE